MELADIPDAAVTAAKLFASTAYRKTAFRVIDFLSSVLDLTLQDELDAKLVEAIKADSDDFEIAIPAITPETVATYRFENANIKGYHADLSLDLYRDELGDELKKIDIETLKKHRVAGSLIESVCRSILAELEIPLPAKQDISGLYRAVREPLGLSPEKEGLSAEIVADVRAVLSGLVTAVQSIGALRTHGGNAHGKTRGARRVDVRIAKLAVNSASAVALFLIETWQLRFPNRRLPATPSH